MPVHDWTLVTPGTFHDFHAAWIAEIRRVLNRELLPSGYYAMAEQIAGEIGPDVLTLQESGRRDEDFIAATAKSPAIAVADAPPRATFMDTVTEAMLLARRRSRLVIHHTTGDRVVAIIELVSQGNKQGREAMARFVDKAISALDQHIHLLVIDLFPPGPLDPVGLNGAIWQRAGGAFQLPADKLLTVASYRAWEGVKCFVEPIAVGQKLPSMPLFLDVDHYVDVPLEETYERAWEGVPEKWQRVLESGHSSGA
ncbi:MAG: DUF4058 family protein [Phycisphaeraceae bacterium]